MPGGEEEGVGRGLKTEEVDEVTAGVEEDAEDEVDGELALLLLLPLLLLLGDVCEVECELLVEDSALNTVGDGGGGVWVM